MAVDPNISLGLKFPDTSSDSALDALGKVAQIGRTMDAVKKAGEASKGPISSTPDGNGNTQPLGYGR